MKFSCGNLGASLSPEFFKMIPLRLGSCYLKNSIREFHCKSQIKVTVLATKVEVISSCPKVTATITTRTIAYQANSLVQVSFSRFSSIGIQTQEEGYDH